MSLCAKCSVDPDPRGPSACGWCAALNVPADPIARLALCATDEIIELRAEVHRLTVVIKAADLVHIRLRAGLREAMNAWMSLVQVTSQYGDYRQDPEFLRAVELRKLVQR